MLVKSKVTYSFEKFAEYISQSLSWGNEFCQLAISILCNRPVNTYSIDRDTNIPYSHEYCMNEKTLENDPITLGFILNHFTAILPCSSLSRPNKPINNEYFSQFYSLFN